MSDSEGSDNLDGHSPAAPAPKPKVKGKAAPSPASKFSVQRDPTPESLLDSESEAEKQVDVPAKRKVASKAIASSKKRSKATAEKESKFFKPEKPKMPKRTSAFGTGHESDEEPEQDQDEEEAANSDDVDAPRAGPSKAKAKAKKEVATDLKAFQVKLGQPQDVAKGQISKSTMQFLAALQLESCNDRQWFAAHDAQYRHAWKQWNDFVDSFTVELQQVDAEIPSLPAKDLTHRIYRDVRFSTDKRPYKMNMAASTSRGGRKSKQFAMFYWQIAANGRSCIAAGMWCPDKNEIATFRHNLLQDPDAFRAVISRPSFVALFGPSEPLPRPVKPKKPRKKKSDKAEEEEPQQPEEEQQPQASRRQNVFGHEDELINAPKGVAKDHEHIDLLRLRTVAVSKTFTDQEVLAPDFKVKLKNVAAEMVPLVHILNDMLTPQSDQEDDQ